MKPTKNSKDKGNSEKKVLIRIWLSVEVVEYYKSNYDDWKDAMNDALLKTIKKSKTVVKKRA